MQRKRRKYRNIHLVPEDTRCVSACLKVDEQILHLVLFVRLGMLRDKTPQTWVTLLGRFWQEVRRDTAVKD
jgi:hypothetical protein